jgi:hypothetical protein
MRWDDEYVREGAVYIVGGGGTFHMCGRYFPDMKEILSRFEERYIPCTGRYFPI